jgi:SPP1 family predicted phage head-tail adaptor
MPASSAAIDAGLLDRRVTLLKPVYNAPEDEVVDWEAVAEVWAGVDPGAGQEIDEAGRMVATVAVPIIIRYRTDVDARWRIRDGDAEYEVKSKLDILRRHVRLQLSCQEVL